MNIITKEELLKVIGYTADNNVGGLTVEDNKLKVRQGDYEYIFNADGVNYCGSGTEFIVATLSDSGWAAHGNPAVVNGTATLDGSSWLSRGSISLGGQDFQISGVVYESASEMTARRKIFELYTSGELNMSLYSSGAGKNLDLLIHCGGTFDNYNEPAMLEREYNFALKWRQAENILKLYVNGEEIYSVTGTGFNERREFEQVLVGGSVYHEGATWKGTISEFKIYDGYAEA